MKRPLFIAFFAATLGAQQFGTGHDKPYGGPVSYDGQGCGFCNPRHTKRSWMRASIRKSFRAVTGHGALHNAGSNRPVGSLAQSTPGAKR